MENTDQVQRITDFSETESDLIEIIACAGVGVLQSISHPQFISSQIAREKANINRPVTYLNQVATAVEAVAYMGSVAYFADKIAQNPTSLWTGVIATNLIGGLIVHYVNNNDRDRD